MLTNRIADTIQASFLATIFGTLTSISTPAQAEDIIIAIPDAPLELTWFQTGYTPDARTPDNGAIAFRAQVKNHTGQAVLAHSIGFFAFDAFNELLTGMTGVSMHTVAENGDETGYWTDDPRDAYRFEKYGTGVAVVTKARLADGTVWKADPAFVLEEMRKIEASLTMEDIKAATSD